MQTIKNPVLFDQESVQKQIEAQNQAFAAALGRGDAAGVANCYTIDAQFMAPNQKPIVGRANIQTTIAGYIGQGFTEYTVLSTTAYGTEGVVGVAEHYTLSQPGGKNQDIGKSIQLWKQEGGVWKIFRDCFNSDLPAQS
jgi:ketosteroid isomerase-like protein